MLARLGDRISAFFRATAPDPFVLAVLLTALTLALVLLLTDASPRAMIDTWSGEAGVWAFLRFSMQMCLILVTGHAVASSPPVRRVVHALARLPRTPAQASALVALVAALLGVLNWGLGLIGGALFARDMGRAMEARGVRVHYPLLAAAGYVGLMVWHGGFSGTAPITVSNDQDIASLLPGVALDAIPLDATVLSWMNLIVTGGLVAIAVSVMALLTPHEKHGVAIRPPSDFLDADEDDDAPAGERKPLIPRLLEDTPIVNLLLAALIAAWALGYYFPGGGEPSGVRSLSPNTVNLTMLMVALVLHGTPSRFVRAVEEAARGCAGIIIQFPLYAGIMGMMHASGLTEQLARTLASASNETTLPIFTFASAAIVNLFVPSGGGQWGIQGPIAIRSALDAGVAPAKMVMAVAYGDQLTNMLQPFWALPLLAITGVKARDIVGYTALLMAAAAAWVVFCLLVL